MCCELLPLILFSLFFFFFFFFFSRLNKIDSRTFPSFLVIGQLKKKKKKKRRGNPSIKTLNMAAVESLSQELLNAIQAPNIRTMPAYLSENDSLTVSDYLQSHYAATYRIDVSNVHWGGDVNSGHLFDIFSSFLPHKDSVKTRLDLIKFVTDNYRRYSWDCDLYLRMNNLTLNDWVEKMTYWGNCGDALSAYALCDMIGIHCCILTRTKP